MNSLREIVEPAPRLRGLAMHSLRNQDSPQPLAPAPWEWQRVRSVLVVRLRSIGDAVLTTPSLYALRRFLPQVQIDIVLEDWVAPVLEGSDLVDRVIEIARDSKTGRARLARELRASHYDVVYNLHGGTTATILTRATGAKHRVGFGHYQYARLHNHAAPSSLEIWQRPSLHSVEQQLALIGWTGVPVTDRPPTQLAVTQSSAAAVTAKLHAAGLDEATPFA